MEEALLMESKDGVFLTEAWFGYSSDTPVLRGSNLIVPKGAIYGLLGPSGCGKTTMLKCMLGRLSVQSGEVSVFGTAPGSSGSTIPGSGVGYMPQELALYDEFTVNETLTYYAKLHGIGSDHLQGDIDFLLDFLDILPFKSYLVTNLSGGQKRRVSLAVALLHNPPLLVLDEPTVGTAIFMDVL